jgi:ParB-like chromosome segregation protein Spo0J
MGIYQVMRDLTGEEYSALKASIIESGVLVPVVLDEHGNIIDGHHRKMICDEIGTTYPVQVMPGMTETEKLNMARQLNEARRQLTPEEKRREIERPYSCESNRDAT